jgi:hypothetical protein
MKTLLKLNKSVAVIILLIISLCLQGSYCYSQGLGALRDKAKKVKDDAKKVKDEAEKTADEAKKVKDEAKGQVDEVKKIKNDAKGQVDEVKKVTGTAGGVSNGNSASGAKNNGQDINANKFYRITNVATGEELAITLTYDANKPLHKSIYESKIELKPVTNIEDASQTWFFYHSNSSPDPTEQQIGTKVGFTSTKSGYILRLSNPDSSYNPDDKINSMQMYHNVGEYNDYWHFVKLSNGYFRIISEFGIAKRLNVRFEERRDHWNEERSVEAVKINGKRKLKQKKTADVDSQYWKLTEVGDIPAR